MSTSLSPIGDRNTIRWGHDDSFLASQVEVATPGAVVPAVDRGSLAAEANGGQDNADAIAAELDAIDVLKSPLELEKVVLADYVAVFYPGGHGPMEDIAVDATSGKLLVGALDPGKPLGIVCHAPAALLATEGFRGFGVQGLPVDGLYQRRRDTGGLGR